VNVTGYRTLRQVAHAGTFEGQTTIGVGVRARLPFRTFTLAGPGRGSRLVIDIAHRWLVVMTSRSFAGPPAAGRVSAPAWLSSPISDGPEMNEPTSPETNFGSTSPRFTGPLGLAIPSVNSDR
jgi:hypothetical protein